MASSSRSFCFARAACLLVVLLLLALLGGAPAAEAARPGPASAHRRALAPRRRVVLSTNAPADDSVPRAAATGDGGTPAPSPPPESDVDDGAIVNVESYGAVGDGRSDDTTALVNAWAEACSSPQPAVLLVPAGKKYLVKETPLSGPCESSKVTVQIDGTLVAPEDKSDWTKHHPRWISFTNVDGLTVTGNGTLDGTGESSWKNSCRVDRNKPCTIAPTALTFASCDRLKVRNIKLVNSPQVHLLVQGCKDVAVSGVTVTAPGNSPETDGIHVSHSEDVRITNPVIASGDDCISVATGVKDLYVYNVACGPGHGISVGSLGNRNSEARVSNVTVDTARVTGTMYGARIKTWQGGSGYARDVRFENMVMDKVKHPIFIDQYYCTQQVPSEPKPCVERESAVQISDVSFVNVRGTGTTSDVISLHCSKTFPCRDVVLRDVHLETTTTKKGGGGKKNAATSSCESVVLRQPSNVSPVPCTSVVARD